MGKRLRPCGQISKIAEYTRGGFTNVRLGDVEVMALMPGGAGPARPVITAGVAPAASDDG